MIYDKANVRAKLETDMRWLTRGLLAIFAHQTASEQNSESTEEDNGVGFSGADAYFLSSVAKQLLAGRTTMSEKQTVYVRKKMLKYAGQLARIANENERKKGS